MLSTLRAYIGGSTCGGNQTSSNLEMIKIERAAIGKTLFVGIHKYSKVRKSIARAAIYFHTILYV